MSTGTPSPSDRLAKLWRLAARALDALAAPSVQSFLTALLKFLPPSEIKDHAVEALPYVLGAFQMWRSWRQR